MEDLITFDIWAIAATERKPAAIELTSELRPELSRADVLRSVCKSAGIRQAMIAVERVTWSGVQTLVPRLLPVLDDVSVFQSGYGPDDRDALQKCPVHDVHFGGVLGCPICGPICRDAILCEVDDLMREFHAERFHPDDFPVRVIERIPLGRVDEFMAALPDDVREITIAHVQDVHASNAETAFLTPPTQEYLRREAALVDWTKRIGRYHYPRRADEPDPLAAQARLGIPKQVSFLDSIFRRMPWKAIRLIPPENLDAALAALEEETRKAIVEWAIQHFTGNPRPGEQGKGRPGAEAAMREWLRRNGHLP